ncbi:hypothetical protein ECZU29_48490 [Escherichia coli]|nr:hypothetical protein ECZU29_48490 [Escherichia coli]
MMIREGVAMHAFNGELFVQATGYQFVAAFRTQFRMVSPKRISNPNNTGDSRNCRAGVQINDSGAALGYYVSEDGYPGWMPQKWTWIPRELPGGVPRSFTFLNPWRTGRLAVQCVLQRDGADEDARHAAEHAAAERHCEGDVCRHH